ncbi:MAG: diacylglycerol kinase family protein [Candidatus Eremiobacteraeota bacterium]|nr:diacylglycerol kinase family protein [Candidatus Eremiobacteraeota bacterium]MBC5828063.1 diacylglycerol kinase family protein [Candidatus Eremiobacteraeota bacterium]
MSRGTFWRAVNDAADGIARTFREEQNFRIQLAVAAAACAAAVALRFSGQQFAVLALTMGFVLACELLNTCLEHAIDLLAPEPNPIARAAKHAGAGAVLVSSIVAATVGVWLFGGAILGR